MSGEEAILELLCNTLTIVESERFSWTKVQGEEDWEGALIDMEKGKVYLVRVREAKLSVVE